MRGIRCILSSLTCIITGSVDPRVDPIWRGGRVFIVRDRAQLDTRFGREHNRCGRAGAGVWQRGWRGRQVGDCERADAEVIFLLGAGVSIPVGIPAMRRP